MLNYLLALLVNLTLLPFMLMIKQSLDVLDKTELRYSKVIYSQLNNLLMYMLRMERVGFKDVKNINTSLYNIYMQLVFSKLKSANTREEFLKSSKVLNDIETSRKAEWLKMCIYYFISLKRVYLLFNEVKLHKV